MHRPGDIEAAIFKRQILGGAYLEVEVLEAASAPAGDPDELWGRIDTDHNALRYEGCGRDCCCPGPASDVEDLHARLKVGPLGNGAAGSGIAVDESVEPRLPPAPGSVIVAGHGAGGRLSPGLPTGRGRDI